MSDFERITLLMSLVGLVLNGVVFIVFVVQLRLLVRQLKQASDTTALDHDRRRQQATLEFIAQTLERRAEMREMLPNDRDGAAIRKLLTRVSKGDPATAKLVSEYLSLHELLATGVRMGIFDFVVLERVAGRILAMYANYEPWIKNQRTALSNPRLYEDLEWFVTRVHDHRASLVAEASGPVEFPGWRRSRISRRDRRSTQGSVAQRESH
jgi:hypothetical protein